MITAADYTITKHAGFATHCGRRTDRRRDFWKVIETATGKGYSGPSKAWAIKQRDRMIEAGGFDNLPEQIEQQQLRARAEAERAAAR